MTRIPTDKIDTDIALRAMAMENSLLQSYRALFTGIQAALLASAFALIKFEEVRWVPWLAVPSLIIGIMWIIVCHAKGNDVDKWMGYLTEKAEEKNYFTYMKLGFTLTGGRIARYWFNWVMPILIIGLWIWVIIFTASN